MAAIDQYQTAHRLLLLVDELRRGEPLTIPKVMRKFHVARAAASRYLSFAREHAHCKTRVRNSKKVVERHSDEQALFARASALTLASATLSWLAGTSLHDELQKLAAEVRSQLPPEAQEDADRVFGLFIKRREPRRLRQYAQVVEQMSQAIRQRRRVKLAYAKLGNAQANYHIEPWCFALLDDTLFVLGRKLPDGVSRSFDVSAIAKCELTAFEFARPRASECDPARIFQHAIGTYSSDAKDPEEVVLRVRGSARSLVDRRPLHVTQALHAPDGDGWSTLRLSVMRCPELTAAILSMLPDVRVVAPRELRDQVRAAARAVDGSDWDP